MTATATDYTWFSARYPWLSEMFSLTMVQGLTPAEVLHRMGAREIATVTGFRQAGRDYDRSTRSIGGEQREQFVAATVDNGWTLALETYGNVTDELTIALSHGTRVVSLLHNAKGLSHFCWAEDGQIRLSFEPLFPTRREGTDPDSLVDVMRQVGFDLREGPDRTFQNFMAAGFALMEYLTGVRFTPAHLESATYLYGGAPIP